MPVVRVWGDYSKQRGSQTLLGYLSASKSAAAGDWTYVMAEAGGLWHTAATYPFFVISTFSLALAFPWLLQLAGKTNSQEEELPGLSNFLYSGGGVPGTSTFCPLFCGLRLFASVAGNWSGSELDWPKWTSQSSVQSESSTIVPYTGLNLW